VADRILPPRPRARLWFGAPDDTESLVGRTLAEARIPHETGLIVLALRRGIAGPPIYNPGPETRLEAGDVMIFLGASEQVERLRNYAELEVTL